MDLSHVQQVALAVTAVGGALTTVLLWKTRIGTWLKRRWQSRTKVVMLAALDRIEKAQQDANQERKQVSHDLADLKRHFVIFGASVRAVIASDTTIATFEASPDGLLIDANRTYLLWTGRTFGELERWGWINCVAPEDRIRVRTEWDSAIRDQRQSTIRFHMIAADGSQFEVRATATPIPEGMIPCEKFVGVIHRLDA